jgi:ABC-type Fe3+ transport system substrate-binding protein
MRGLRGAVKYRRPLVSAVAVGVATVTFTMTDVGLPSASAATSSWSSVLAAAKSEGAAVGLDTRPATWQSVVESAFTKYSNGLHFSVAESGPNGELETRLLSQWAAGVKETDYLEDVNYNFFYQNANKFVNLATAGIPNWSSWPSNLKFYSGNSNVCVTVISDITGVVYNTNLVPAADVPTSWSSLLNPYWKGKMEISLPTAGAPASKGEPATAGNYYMEGMLLLENAFGRSYLRQLFGQSPTFEASSITGAEMVASGADQISVLSQVDSSSSLIKEGAPLKFVPLTNPDIGTGGCVGILKNAPHPDTAKALFNFFMTKTAVSTPCSKGVIDVAPPPLTANGCYIPPSGWRLPTLSKAGLFPDLSNPTAEHDVLLDLGAPGA